MKNIIGLIALALIAFGVVWLIFSPQAEKFENTSAAPGVATAGNIYSDTAFGFSVSVPDGFTVDQTYLNQDLGPGREIPGVAFRVPRSWTDGTNLSPDSYIAVEELADVECTPSTFMDTTGASLSDTPVIMGDNSFSTASLSDAGAGNRYSETVRVVQKGSRCFDVKSFLHSTNIGAYDPGTVKEFDANAFGAAYDSLTSSLTLH